MGAIQQPFSGFFRVPFVCRCTIEGGAGPRHALLCNISIEGVYLSLDPIPGIGERVRLSFPLPESEVPVKVEAEVCWRNPAQQHKVHGLPPGCGVRFLALSEPDRGRIEALVRSYREPGPPRPEWL